MSLRTPLLAIILAGLLGLGAQPLAAQELVIGAGSVEGLYYKVSRHLCKLVNRYSLKRYRCSARPALGSVFNINAVAEGLLDFGMAQSDRSWQATTGNAEWQGRPVAQLRSVLSLHPETVLLVARADSGIHGVADLRGKRINIGNPGSGQRGNAEDILRLHGLDIENDVIASEWQQHRASRAIVAGEIDAFIYTAGNPTEAVSIPAASTPLRLVPLNSGAILNFVSGKTYYMMTEVPAHTYPGVEQPVPTYGVRANLMASVKTPPDVVYDVVRIVIEHLDELRSFHPALNELTPNIMLSALSAPLHEGAKRYYRERGWILPDNSH
ncbi:MAG: TAXI family TRAP transporter solute-binding subunit [Gammaproteobacteria bacterium]